MCASFNGKPCTTIVSCYNLTNAGDETDIITFNSKLSSLVWLTPKHDVFTIAGNK